MIDCHAHLAAEEFDKDIDEVIARAKKSGVTGVIVVAEFVDEQEKVLELAAKYSGFCFAAVGLHPVQVLILLLIHLILILAQLPFREFSRF
jgi:TatD DNase family protein